MPAEHTSENTARRSLRTECDGGNPRRYGGLHIRGSASLTAKKPEAIALFSTIRETAPAQRYRLL